jgi:hypothetical protein
MAIPIIACLEQESGRERRRRSLNILQKQINVKATHPIAKFQLICGGNI